MVVFRGRRQPVTLLASVPDAYPNQWLCPVSPDKSTGWMVQFALGSKLFSVEQLLFFGWLFNVTPVQWQRETTKQKLLLLTPGNRLRIMTGRVPSFCLSGGNLGFDQKVPLGRPVGKSLKILFLPHGKSGTGSFGGRGKYKSSPTSLSTFHLRDHLGTQHSQSRTTAGFVGPSDACVCVCVSFWRVPC